jgi:hypothetical protein
MTGWDRAVSVLVWLESALKVTALFVITTLSAGLAFFATCGPVGCGTFSLAPTLMSPLERYPSIQQWFGYGFVAFPVLCGLATGGYVGCKIMWAFLVDPFSEQQNIFERTRQRIIAASESLTNRKSPSVAPSAPVGDEKAEKATTHHIPIAFETTRTIVVAICVFLVAFSAVFIGIGIIGGLIVELVLRPALADFPSVQRWIEVGGPGFAFLAGLAIAAYAGWQIIEPVWNDFRRCH